LCVEYVSYSEQHSTCFGVHKDIGGRITLKLDSMILVLMAYSSVEILQIVLLNYMELEPRTSVHHHHYENPQCSNIKIDLKLAVKKCFEIPLSLTGCHDILLKESLLVIEC
jgi:hypothetical protein